MVLFILNGHILLARKDMDSPVFFKLKWTLGPQLNNTWFIYNINIIVIDK